MARPEVPDTGVWIHAMRCPITWRALERALAAGRIWLSSVATAELYAGTRSPEDGRALDRIVAAMYRAERLLTPAPGDWVRAGRLIAHHVRLRGALRPRDHLADVLIVVSAARIGGVVVTANMRHFEAWVELASASGLDVTVAAFQP